MSGLSDRLRAGRFTITAELSPVRGASADAMRVRAQRLLGWVDAVNLTDNQGSHVRMSSWAAAIAAREAGLEPIMQMTCRDRNRIALQSDLLGAASVGLENFLFMSGDHPKAGDHPGAKPVFDLDSTQLTWTARLMRDDGLLLSGAELKPPPAAIFLGAVENQYVFDIPVFKAWLVRLRDLGLLERCHVLAGVGVIRSARMLEFLGSGRVPGVTIPDSVRERLEGVPADEVGAEGKRLAAEIIAELREVPGVSGIHLLTAGYEKQTPSLLEMAGVAAGRGARARPEPAGERSVAGA